MRRRSVVSVLGAAVLAVGCGEVVAPAGADAAAGGPASLSVGGGGCSAPAEARHPISYTAFSRPPFGFAAATPWLNVLHDTRVAGSSTVEIDYIRLWARLGGVPRVVAANEYDDGKFGGQLCARSPWYGGPCTAMPGTVSGGVLVIHPGSHPDRVWHPYLESYPDPRAYIGHADSAWMEVRFRISGPGLVQAGLDYWQYVSYGSTNRLEEAATSDWACTAGTWQTLGLEPSTTVVDSIRITTTPAGSPLQVGTPTTGTFTLLNADDDTVRLAEVGIETRRNDSGLCDPARDPWVAAFSWRFGDTLAPGASVRHSATWVPSQPGTYCMAVVEKRVDSPDYRRTHMRKLHQTRTVQ